MLRLGGHCTLAIPCRAGYHCDVIKAVLWDNDGVLVDSEAIFFEVTRRFFAEAGVALPAELWARGYLGDARRSRDIGVELGIPEHAIDPLIERRNARFREELREVSPVRPGIVETLQALHGRVRQAIVTGASREHVDLTHRTSGLLRFFEVIITTDDYELVKPHPDSYLAALRRMKIAAEDAIAVEDSPRGARAALAAGVRCVVIPTSLSRLAEFPPEAQIEWDVRRLKEWIESCA